MPNDLENAFAALSDDARHARLAPAAAVRRAADRRAVTRALGAVAAAAVLVAGVTVGARLVLADDAHPPLPPAQSTTPTAAPSASSTPSTSATPSSTEAGTPSIPASIPARAFLGRSDANVASLRRLDPPEGPPEFCAAARYPSDARAGVRGTVSILYRANGDDAEHTPSGEVHDTVTVYSGDGAEDFMDEFRAAVRACPRGEREHLTFTYRSLGSLGVGDESVLVQGSTPARGDDGELSGDGSTYRVYVAAVRIGDSVALVENRGYESISAERTVAEGFARRAAERLAAWRD
ncbi:hypothetical protein ACIBSW_08845 [Actinoplanes sp. NPDC049668]|uniref:hypothetical protein n=1 Tax=unclassified Actinoplanes TaxID=2626549 RepID=UPI0033A96543